MIKASELRIGNLIHKYGEVLVFSLQSFLNVYKKQNGFEEYKPIPLTEEWLLKFGFVYLKGHGWVVGDVFSFNINDSFELDWYEQAPLKYVHQLQNLYFALTGKELTIKDK
jgi:hypothetical protein